MEASETRGCGTGMPAAEGGRIRERNVVLYFILSLLTCGLFCLYWFCTLNDDTNRVSNHPEGPCGVVALLLSFVTCGIYGWFWAYAMGSRVDEARQARLGLPDGSSGALYLILALLGLPLLAFIIQQSELNRMAD